MRRCATCDTRDLERLRQAGDAARQAVLHAPLPPALERAIGRSIRIALAEEAGARGCLDGRRPHQRHGRGPADASFAGQQETYLNVRATAALLEACQRCFASLFTDRAISYRVDQGFDHLRSRSRSASSRWCAPTCARSGVMFTLDTETGFRDVVLINAAYGLGENVVRAR